jgi:hypothetical protein
MCISFVDTVQVEICTVQSWEWRQCNIVTVHVKHNNDNENSNKK